MDDGYLFHMARETVEVPVPTRAVEEPCSASNESTTDVPVEAKVSLVHASLSEALELLVHRPLETSTRPTS